MLHPLATILTPTDLGLLARLQSAVLPVGAGVGPDWVQLLPAGVVTTRDGRGPYSVEDLAALMRDSLADGEGRLVIDENHATDLAGPKGLPAPAMGWIVEMAERQGGVWGRVEWTEAGGKLVAARAYRGLSPVVLHDKSGRIARILRASLTNTPNLRGLATLHHQETETEMDEFLKTLCAALGLAEDAGQEAALARVAELAAANPEVALQAALAPIAAALGPDVAAEATAILGAIKTKVDPAQVVPAAAVKALQAELTELRSSVARDKALVVVDGAIAAGKPGIKPLRDHYIARHMAEPAAVERELAAMPSLTGCLPAARAPEPGAKPELGDVDRRVCALMGLDPVKYLETLAAEAAEQEAL